jgi:putative hydrolase of HD superfamily
MVLKDLIPESEDFDHAIMMALVHDLCEIGAGDISVYSPERSEQRKNEAEYMDLFKESFPGFGEEAAALWQEYEDQESQESQWVKVADRFLPFLLNLATQGKTWKEQQISRSQVVNLNKNIRSISPNIFEWMLVQMDEAVQNGWLLDE